MANLINHENIENIDLVCLAKSGDSQAQAFMLNKYKNLVNKIARTFFIMGADFEDIVQEGMIGLFNAVMSYDSDKNVSFISYADICITRHIINALKKANRKKHAPLNDYVPLNEHNVVFSIDFLNLAEKSPEESLIIKEEQKKIMDEIKEALSDFEATTLNLYLDGMSYLEIGNKLKKNEKAIDNAVQRIRKKIKKIITIQSVDIDK